MKTPLCKDGEYQDTDLTNSLPKNDESKMVVCVLVSGEA